MAIGIIVYNDPPVSINDRMRVSIYDSTCVCVCVSDMYSFIYFIRKQKTQNKPSNH